MGRRFALVTGGVAVTGAALWRVLRRRPAGPLAVEAEVDPRAEELRRRLDEARPVVEDREEFEGAETPVDQAEPVADPADRRRAVHAEGRAAVDRMRSRTDDA